MTTSSSNSSSSTATNFNFQDNEVFISYEVSDLIKKLGNMFVEVLFDTGKNQNQNQVSEQASE